LKKLQSGDFFSRLVSPALSYDGQVRRLGGLKETKLFYQPADPRRNINQRLANTDEFYLAMPREPKKLDKLREQPARDLPRLGVLMNFIKNDQSPGPGARVFPDDIQEKI
jgi:hypothetical protein